MLARQGKNKAANLSLCHFASALFSLRPQIRVVLNFNQDKEKENRKVLDYGGHSHFMDSWPVCPVSSILSLRLGFSKVN